MSQDRIQLPDLEDVQAAARRIAPFCVRTPLMPFESDNPDVEIHLKLENIQQMGAFNARAICNVLLSAEPEQLEQGVYAVVSGNGGLALAWMARELDVSARIYARESTQPWLVQKIQGLGASVELIPEDTWWQLIMDRGHTEEKAYYVDSLFGAQALAGYGTVVTELLEQLPSVETIVIPFGGGGLACGIASVIKSLKSATRLIIVECDTATPLTSALESGNPVRVETRSSFITGTTAPAVLDDMWPLLSKLVDDSIVVSRDEVADAVRKILNEAHVAAEGAGALPLAAVLKDKSIKGKTVCLVSGGNIDADMMSTILAGKTP